MSVNKGDFNKNIDDRFYVRYINETHGYGVFAKQDITGEQVVGEIFAEYHSLVDWFKNDLRKQDMDIVKADYDLRKSQSYLFNTNYQHDESKFLVLDGSKHCNMFCLINNVGYHNVVTLDIPMHNKWRKLVFAVKTIKKDQQLSIEYSKEGWMPKGQKELIETYIKSQATVDEL